MVDYGPSGGLEPNKAPKLMNLPIAKNILDVILGDNGTILRQDNDNTLSPRFQDHTGAIYGEANGNGFFSNL